MVNSKIETSKDDISMIGRLFSTPLIVKGKTWFPLTPLILWPIMANTAKKRNPDRSWKQSFRIGAITTPIILASEWGHNLAHAAAAKLVGKPMDAIRIMWGMPRVIYDDINDPNVSPKQHILRSLGGPIFNLLLLPFAYLCRKLTKPNSPARDAANAALGANTLIPMIGLLPIPGIDGGPILKWSLVKRGRTPQQADQVVRKVNQGLGIFLGLSGIVAFKKSHRAIGGLLISLAAAALSFGLGILKEQE